MNAGRIVIERCVFKDNLGLTGGGLYITNTDGIIRDSSFIDNTARSSGGGIDHTTYGFTSRVLLENTTISGNRAAYGGGVKSEGHGILTIRSSTIFNNTAPFGSALFLENVARPNLVIESSLIQGGCRWPGSNYPPTSLGGNLQSPDGFCFLEHPTDQTVEDFGLGPLEASDNGFTHPLLPGSLAIDAGASCPPHDQRGAPRPQDGDGDGVALCDAGATELGTPNGLADVPVLPRAGLGLLAAFLALAALRRL